MRIWNPAWISNNGIALLQILLHELVLNAAVCAKDTNQPKTHASSPLNATGQALCIFLNTAKSRNYSLPLSNHRHIKIFKYRYDRDLQRTWGHATCCGEIKRSKAAGSPWGMRLGRPRSISTKLFQAPHQNVRYTRILTSYRSQIIENIKSPPRARRNHLFFTFVFTFSHHHACSLSFLFLYLR